VPKGYSVLDIVFCQQPLTRAIEDCTMPKTRTTGCLSFKPCIHACIRTCIHACMPAGMNAHVSVSSSSFASEIDGLHVLAFTRPSNSFIETDSFLPFLARTLTSMHEIVVLELQVLRRLPPSLAIAVLASSRLRLHQHLSILPASLHHLAVKAAVPLILKNRSFNFDFCSTAGKNSAIVCAVPHVATTAVPALEKLHFQHITVNNNEGLLRLIAATCTSASDLSLSCWSIDVKRSSQAQPFAKLIDALYHNRSLTSLQLADIDDPAHGFNLDNLLKRHRRLQSLSLAFKIDPGDHSQFS
jgi:hypothetical protein